MSTRDYPHRDPAVEPDAEPGAFARHLYDEALPPPALTDVGTRVQVDESGRPVSPAARHTRGLKRAFGPLLVLVPLQAAVAVGVSLFPDLTLIAVAGVSALLLLSAVSRAVIVPGTVATPGATYGGAVAVAIVVALALVAGGFGTATVDALFWTGFTLLLVFFGVFRVLSFAALNTTPRDCVFWAVCFPALYLIALLPRTVAPDWPLAAFVAVVGVANVGWAILVGVSYMRFLVANPFLEAEEYFRMTRPPARRPDGVAEFVRNLVPTAAVCVPLGMFVGCIMVALVNLARPQPDSVARYVAGIEPLFLTYVMAAAALFANELLVSGRFPTLRTFLLQHWIGWRAVAVYLGWRAPERLGAFNFPRPQASPAVRAGLTYLVIALNTVVVLCLLVGPWFPALLPDLPAGQATEASPTFFALVPRVRIAIVLAVLLGPALLAYTALLCVSAGLVAHHEFVELRHARSRPPAGVFDPFIRN